MGPERADRGVRTAEIVDRTPDQQITWHSLDGTDNRGTVLFTPSDAGTRVTLRMDFDPDAVVERTADLQPDEGSTGRAGPVTGPCSGRGGG